MSAHAHGHGPEAPTAERVSIPAASGWSRLPLLGGAAAVIGLGASAALAGGDPKQFYFSYLVAFLYFLSLGIGGLFFVLAQHAARAGWSVVLRRLAEDVMGALPLFAPLFIPIALGAHELFHWTHHEAVAGDAVLQGKTPYLNQTFFFIRAAVYLLAWSGISWWFRSRSVQQDVSGDPELTRKLQVASGPSILIYALTVSFAAFDWIMSLDPHWYSTIFGIYYFSGAVVGIFALMIVLSVGLSRSRLLGSTVSVEHFHDLGKYLLAFVAFWAYIAFSQYFLIWYANIPEETIWFLHRWKGTWQQASLALGLGHFALPFFFLLPRTVKRSAPALVFAALWMLALHYLDIYWLVMPTLHHETLSFSLLDLTTFVGLGGAFLAVVGWLLRRSPLIPVKDPRLSESLTFENV